MSTINNYLFESLNPQQADAVSHFDGPLLVIAGAGSGKTKALTHRIANLIQFHEINTKNILAVTFTNKAAKEMKERIEIILAKALCKEHYPDQLWSNIGTAQQNLLREIIFKDKLKDLWIGTFHSLFSKLLRFDIEKYVDPDGLTWKKSFSIYDEKDSLTLIKEIIKNEMRVDDFQLKNLDLNPKKIKYRISSAKNKCLTSKQLEDQAKDEEKKFIAEVYKRYKKSLSKNNALDFDDLILIPVLLLKQNELVRDYWHKRFKHILIDEYQDTNQTQYELIKLITTNTKENNKTLEWKNRSIFVVGDADQSIYSFRAADFKILMNFQKDFNNQGDFEVPMIKLEKNYRSTSNILNAANNLIRNNQTRIEKTLEPTRENGDPIKIITCEDEKEEAAAVINKIEMISKLMDKPLWSHFAILYRTRAQSRLFDKELRDKKIPFKVSGLSFYDRKEIKDIHAYLKILVNHDDDGSLLRIINIPKRGIGQTTIKKLRASAEDLNISLFDFIRDENCLKSVLGKSHKGIDEFVAIMNELSFYLSKSPSTVIQLIFEKSGYWEDLNSGDHHEDSERKNNLNELINAAIQYEEENPNATMEDYLSSMALATDAETKENKDKTNAVTLMTLHNSKGLEFKNVFITGLEQGLFPSYNSLNNPSDLEEERRLCYVGLTRAKDRVFLSHARERLQWGGERNRLQSESSIFLDEIPYHLIKEEEPRGNGSSRAKTRLDRLTRVDRENTFELSQKPFNSIKRLHSGPSKGKEWMVGDKLIHLKFGIGEIEKIMGIKNKTLIVKFAKIAGNSKVLDPRIAPIKPFGQ